MINRLWWETIEIIAVLETKSIGTSILGNKDGRSSGTKVRRLGTCCSCCNYNACSRMESGNRMPDDSCSEGKYYALYIDRVVLHLLHLIEVGEIDIQVDATETEDLRSVVVSNYVRESVLFPPLWCKQAGSQDSMGMTYIEPYEEVINAVVEGGSEKMEMLCVHGKFRRRFGILTRTTTTSLQCTTLVCMLKL